MGGERMKEGHFKGPEGGKGDENDDKDVMERYGKMEWLRRNNFIQ